MAIRFVFILALLLPLAHAFAEISDGSFNASLAALKSQSGTAPAALALYGEENIEQLTVDQAIALSYAIPAFRAANAWLIQFSARRQGLSRGEVFRLANATRASGTAHDEILLGYAAKANLSFSEKVKLRSEIQEPENRERLFSSIKEEQLSPTESAELKRLRTAGAKIPPPRPSLNPAGSARSARTAAVPWGCPTGGCHGNACAMSVALVGGAMMTGTAVVVYGAITMTQPPPSKPEANPQKESLSKDLPLNPTAEIKKEN